MRRESPFGNVQPDDPPQAYCDDCGKKYNPYKHGLGNCPVCSRESADAPVVDPADPETW